MAPVAEATVYVNKTFGANAQTVLTSTVDAATVDAALSSQVYEEK